MDSVKIVVACSSQEEMVGMSLRETTPARLHLTCTLDGGCRRSLSHPLLGNRPPCQASPQLRLARHWTIWKDKCLIEFVEFDHAHQDFYIFLRLLLKLLQAVYGLRLSGQRKTSVLRPPIIERVASWQLATKKIAMWKEQVKHTTLKMMNKRSTSVGTSKSDDDGLHLST